jgi:hypothetical protein
LDVEHLLVDLRIFETFDRVSKTVNKKGLCRQSL